jgi:hypothetical protein
LPETYDQDCFHWLLRLQRYSQLRQLLLQPPCVASLLQALLQPPCTASLLQALLQPPCTASLLQALLQPQCMASLLQALLLLLLALAVLPEAGLNVIVAARHIPARHH